MRLLIGYDGSPGADAALDELRQGGLPAKCDAIVLSVADGFIPPEPALSDVAARNQYDHFHREVLAQVERCRVQAQRAADHLKRGFPGWAVQAEAIADSPGWGVIRRAEGWEGGSRADLVAVGATGRSALGRMLLGSVAHKVVTYAQCSVRVSRLATGRADTNVQLLVGVDGSPDAFAAVRAVCSRYWPAGTNVHVVCVIDTRLKAMHAALRASDADEVAEILAEQAASELRGVGLAVTKHVAQGDAKDELLKQAEQVSANCVFVGARGLSRVNRILLGSVSTGVAMRAACSVEVARSPGA